LKILAYIMLCRTGMKVGVSTWKERISPVFDVAQKMTVVELEDWREIRRQQETLSAIEPERRTRQVADLGVDILICGKISRLLEQMLESSGVQVISDTCGPVHEVLDAFVTGRLTERAFLTPGCRCRRHQFHGRRRGGRERSKRH